MTSRRARSVRTSPRIVAQARSRIAKPSVQKPRRKADTTRRGSIQPIRITKSTSSKPSIRKVIPKVRASSQTQPVVRRVPTPVRISSQQKPQPIVKTSGVFNPIGNVFNFIEQTSKRNAARKEELKKQGKLPAQQKPKADVASSFNLDDIYGGFL